MPAIILYQNQTDYALVRQSLYGFRVHVRCCWPGVITQFDIAPANVAETAAVPELSVGTRELLLGDRNYWNPALKEELQQGAPQLEAPFRRATTDPLAQAQCLA